MFSLLLSAALIQAPLAAQDAGPPPTVPTAEQFLRYYPERAQRMNLTGRATIRCRVTEAGLLEDCHVTAEDPPDAGFGEAALKLSHLFKMRPMTKDGKPVPGGEINIPIRFQLP